MDSIYLCNARCHSSKSAQSPQENQIEDSFVEYEEEDEVPQLHDPFASLTAAELAYFVMAAPSSPS
jgi:hypothetical protein